MLSAVRAVPLAAAVALSAAPASAIIVDYDFIATVVQDPTGLYLGQTGTGTFTYDNAQTVLIGGDAGEANLFAVSPLPIILGNYDFTFTFNGQTFSDPDSPLSVLNIFGFEPISWGAEFNADEINDPMLAQIRTVPAQQSPIGNLFDVNPEDGTLEVGLIVEVVPLPASFWMLGAGLLGLGAWARRRKRTA